MCDSAHQPLVAVVVLLLLLWLPCRVFVSFFPPLPLSFALSRTMAMFPQLSCKDYPLSPIINQCLMSVHQFPLQASDGVHSVTSAGLTLRHLCFPSATICLVIPSITRIGLHLHSFMPLSPHKQPSDPKAAADVMPLVIKSEVCSRVVYLPMAFKWLLIRTGC